MKKIISLVFALMLTLLLAVPVFAADTYAPAVLGEDGLYYLSDSTVGYRYPSIPAGLENGSNIEFTVENYINDEAELFTPDEEENLFQMVKEIREKYSFDLVVHTCNSMGSYTVTEYADQYFDYNGYGFGLNRDGLLFMLCMGGGEGNRDFYTSTNGYGLVAFTDYAIRDSSSAMYEDVLPELRDGNYYNAYVNYIETADKFLDEAKNGDAPFDVGNSYSDSDDFLMLELVALAISIAAAVIVTASAKAKMKTNRIKTVAENYVKPNSMRVTDRKDMFIRKTVSKTAKPKDTSSGSGGSSSHSSSGGGSHGGGGGKF